MSIKILKQDSKILLRYEEEFGRGAKWLDDKLKSFGEYTFRRTFTVTSAENVPIDEFEDGESTRYYQIGSTGGEYCAIFRKVLGLKHDILIHESVKLDLATFVATKDISIFHKIDELVDEQIVVGGTHERAIPDNEFKRLLKEFPTSTELRRYTDARIANILGDYLETMSDAEGQLSKYFSNKQKHLDISSLPHKDRTSMRLAKELELQKYQFVLDRLKEMLNDALGCDERVWQQEVKDLLLLIYPQYIVALRELPVKEWYSKQFKMTKRSPDFSLINYTGNVDIVEIKKPETPILRNGVYRDNYIASRDLSGTIMQAEKYIFYLNKGGRELETSIQEKIKGCLPQGAEVKIANPKAIVLLGRDEGLSNAQMLDLEIIKRKFANVVDVVTYDDLLRRLQNIIASLKKRD